MIAARTETFKIVGESRERLERAGRRGSEAKDDTAPGAVQLSSHVRHELVLRSLETK
jgi:hypothetical protein